MIAKTSELLYVVDVGASGGIHPRWSKLSQEVKAILFEPDPREFNRLKPTLDNDNILLNAALSDSYKEIEFHLYKDQQASSTYLPNREILEKYYADMGKFEIVETIKMSTETLDGQLSKAGLVDIDFVKVDVQGHELPILRGGGTILKEVTGVEVEVEFLPVYKDQPLFCDVNAFLNDAGFELFDIKRTYRNRRGKLAYGNRKGQLLWGDALFFKSPEHLLSNGNISAEKIMRACNVYLAYNYPDLAETLLDLATEKGLLPDERANQVAGWLTAYKVERMNVVPDFKGRNRLHRLLSKLTHLFSRSYRTERQEDAHLGNPS